MISKNTKLPTQNFMTFLILIKRHQNHFLDLKNKSKSISYLKPKKSLASSTSLVQTRFPFLTPKLNPLKNSVHAPILVSPMPPIQPPIVALKINIFFTTIHDFNGIQPISILFKTQDHKH